MTKSLLRLLALGSVCALASTAFAAHTVRLSELDLEFVEHLRSRIAPPPSPGLTPDGKPITIADRKFDAGVSVRGISRFEIALDGRATALHGWVGVTDDSDDAGPVWFEVVGDGRMLFESRELRRGEQAVEMSVPLAGVKHVILVVQAPNSFTASTAWADTRIDYEGDLPKSFRRAPEPSYILTPDSPAAPRINGATVFGARPGNPVLYSVAASGERPMRFSAQGLPAGLTLDAANGRISGRVAKTGEYPVRITVENAHGTATREIKFVIGKKLALTPPMGWNSWYCFGEEVTADDVRAAADAMVKAGLDQHGYSYVNIDDYWMTRPRPEDPIWKKLEAKATAIGFNPFPLKVPPADDPTLLGPARDGQGRINSNPRFADMPALIDYIHARGLKAGIYSSPGALTCGRCWASLGHEAEDAARFAEWGLDFLKHDWCAYRFEVSRRIGIPIDELRKPYEIMAKALAQQPRDMVFSLCQYGLGEVWKWGASAGGNMWRTTRDITDTWGSMSGIAFMQTGREGFARPGHWNDLDMLMVGQIWWGANRRQTRLTPDEQYTQLSMWSLQAAPLLISCDLTKLDDFTRNLLTNHEVIDVNQDPLGHAGRRVAMQRNVEVWSRPLADGSLAVGLFNRGEIPAEVTAYWADLGLAGQGRVRDLWRQKDLGEFTDRFTALIPRHGVVLVRVTPMPGKPAALKQTDVFVGGQDGYHTYRIPVLLVSKKGTLLAFCEGRKDNDRDAGDIDLLLKRSFDGGKTWQPVQFIHGEPGRIAIGNPVAMVDQKTGAIHLVFVREAREVFYVQSLDDGATFSAPVNITSVVKEMYRRAGFDWAMVHTGPGHGLQMRSGRLIVPLKTMGKAQPGVQRRVGVIFSDDHGATWQGGGVVSPEIGELSESTAIERADGSILLNMRWHDGTYRAVSTSADGGLTWSQPRPAVALSDQVCQGSLIHYAPDPTDKRVLFANLPAPFRGYGKRSGLTVRLSRDDGLTWPKSQVVAGGFSGYSDLAVTAGGQVLILFETGTKIYSDKLALAWLDGIAD